MSKSENSNESPSRAPDLDTAQAAESARPRNPYTWAAVGTVLGLALLYVALRNVDLSALGTTLRTVDLSWAAIVVISQLVFVALKAWRWGLLLRFVPGIRFRELQAAIYAGLTINYIVAHVGEFLRAMTVAKRRGVSVSAVLASVFVERALDFIALLFVLGIAAVFATNLPDIFAAMSVMIVGVVVMAITGLYLLLNPPGWVGLLVTAIARSLPTRLVKWLDDQFVRFRLGLSSVRDPRLMALTVILSLVQWSVVVFLMWASCVAVGEFVSLMAVTMAFLLVVVGQQLPNSPLQVGTTQLAFVLGLGTDGVGATSAVAASLVFTVFAMIPTMLLGGVCMIHDRPHRFFRLR